MNSPRSWFVPLALILGLSPIPAEACWTPLEWQHKPVPWNLDRNRDSIDDSLVPIFAPIGVAAPQPEPTFDVVVDLTHCPQTEEMKFLGSFGKVLKRGRFVTFVVLEGVRRSDLFVLAQNPLVAMIERMRGFGGSLDVSTAAIKVRDSIEYPLNLEAVFPSIQGLGTTVGIIDSGVDDQDGPGITHESFPPGKWVGGYDVATNTLTDTDDTNGHGTHVAGIAVGTGGSSQTFRGVAPQAGLVECKTTLACGPASELDVIECFEQVLLNQASWKVDVVNLSLKQCDVFGTTIPQNGLDSVSQLANYLVSQGISVVAAAANDGPSNSGLTTPCAADNAICVAAVDDQGTVDRADDTIAGFSSRGPRDDDGDLDASDEQKPEVCAPGVDIHSAAAGTAGGYVDLSGTSMASPHVAGAVALIRQAKPGINPGSIKNLLIQTAEDLAPAGWDPASGHGCIDVYQAVSSIAKADPGYPNAGTYPESWLCSDITTAAAPKVGVPNTILAAVKNNSGIALTNVQVTFGVYIYSTGTPQFYSIGALTESFLPFEVKMLSFPWTPQMSASGDPHACLQSTIDYGFDSNFANNDCQRNISIDQTMSPVDFRFEVQNPFPGTDRVTVTAAPERRFPGALPGDDRYRLLPGERVYVPARWQQSFDVQELPLTLEDCPREMTFTLTPVAGARPIEGAVFGVVTRALAEGRATREIGGVTAYGHTPCPEEWGGDADGDGVCGRFDNCENLVNPEQMDADGDGVGDLCDATPVETPPLNLERCDWSLKTTNLYRPFRCLDKVRRRLSKIWWSTTSEVLLSQKVGAAQAALCRRSPESAIARLEALQEFVALFDEIGALPAGKAPDIRAQLAACLGDLTR